MLEMILDVGIFNKKVGGYSSASYMAWNRNKDQSL